MLINLDSELHNGELLYIGNSIRDILLLCEDTYTKAQLNIRKAEIKRIEKDPEKKRHHYALCFLDIENNEKKLNDFILRCQRAILEKRNSLA